MNAFSSARRLPALLALALTLAFAPQMARAHGYKVGDIEIGHPWSRATPAGASVAAGYMKLHNNGASPDRLVSITSDIAAAAAVHEMAVDAAGVMTMRAVEGGVEIPAGGDVEMKPGGFHVMFTGLKHPLKAGERFPATLTFEKAGAVAVEFVIDAPGGSGHDSMEGMDDMKMDHTKMDGSGG